MAPTADLSVMGMTRLIADFMDVLDLRDVILVGNDTGGAYPSGEGILRVLG
jgi:pimeloyl-ACP methyl ester carboxylesterase